MQPLVNRVAASPLVTIKLDELAPRRESVDFDLADYLWQGLALRERDFREAVRGYDWSALDGKRLCVRCSADAVIPQWAYMLVASAAAPYATEVFVGSVAEAERADFARAADRLDVETYRDRPVVIKGCSDGREVGPQAYATIMHRLVGVAKSVMYGEPCSTVPIYKRRAAASPAAAPEQVARE